MSVLATAVIALTTTATPAPAAGHADAAKAHATMINIDGEAIGTASLRQGPAGVLLHLKVSGITPGPHGLHLHSHGMCEPGDGFRSAKGHVGMVAGAHGLLNPDGPEPGDLPNLFVGADGVGEMEAFSTFVSLVDGPNNLLDADGSTLMIHEHPDDHVSQPIGGSGPRIACGLIVAAD